MAAKIMPDAEYLREALLYDPGSGSLMWRVRPRSHFNTSGAWKTFNKVFAGKPFGTVVKTTTDVLYIRGRIGDRGYFAHRIAYKIQTGNEPLEDVDHRDGNGLNNRWINLREATITQTRCNTKDRRTTALRGAFLRNGRYIARARLLGKSYYFGTYDTAQQAHAAYIDGTLALHEQFSFIHRKVDSNG